MPSSTIAPGLYAHKLLAAHWIAVLQPTKPRGYQKLIAVSHPGLACRWVHLSPEGFAGVSLLPKMTNELMLNAARTFAQEQTG